MSADFWLQSNVHPTCAFRLTAQEQQDFIVNVLVNGELNTLFPCSGAYQRSFLKAYLEKCERTRASEAVPVIESLYAAYLASLSAVTSAPRPTADAASTYCFKTYLFSSTLSVTLRERTELISEGTTGLNTWEAALALAEWVLTHLSDVDIGHIVELGTGTGLVGVVLAKASSAARITLTDCHAGILSLLQENMRVNGIDLESPQRRSSTCTADTGGRNSTASEEDRAQRTLPVPCDPPSTLSSAPCRVHIRHLDWMDFGPSEAAQLRAAREGRGDRLLVIGSDLIYDPTIIPHLVATIVALLQPYGPSRGGAEALIVSTVRNPATLALFVATLAAAGLAVVELELPPRLYPWPGRSARVLLHRISVALVP